MMLERSISMVMINGEEKEIAGKNLLEYLFYGERIGCMLYIGMHMFMGAM